MNPEHIHLLVNHIPIHGLIFATIAAIIGLICESKQVIITGAVLTLLSSLSIPVVMGSGEAAYERYQKEPNIVQHMDMGGMHWAKKHYENAEKGAKATYLLILLSAGVLAAAKFKPTWLFRLAWVMVFVALASVSLNAWIASSGGKIRRPDFYTTSSVEHE